MIELSTIDRSNAGKLFDYSILPKQTQESDIREGCRVAREYNCASFYSATPYWTPVIVEELAGSSVLPASGIDFPFGASPGILKAHETELAVAAGCRCVDLVVNVGALRDKRYSVVKDDFAAFKQAAGDAVTKVILEVCYLSSDEIRACCELIAEAGLQYAKTSSGQFEGPSMEQFLVMKETLRDSDVKLKVAGVKFPRPQNAWAFILAGADLIGTRAAPEIIDSLDQMRTIGLVPAYAE